MINSHAELKLVCKTVAYVALTVLM